MMPASKMLLLVKDNLDNVDHLITIVTIISFFVTLLSKHFQKQKIKNNLNLSLEKNVKKVEKSCDKLMDSYLLMIGSFAFYQNYEPRNSEEKANKLVQNFNNNYRKMIRDTKELINVLDIYESDLDTILNREDKFSLKHIKQAFNGKNPDFEIIYRDVKFQKILAKQLTAPKKFNGILDTKIQKMTKRMNIKLFYINQVKKVVLNKDFQQDVKGLIFKYVKS
jgi:hypothetical protein